MFPSFDVFVRIVCPQCVRTTSVSPFPAVFAWALCKNKNKITWSCIFLHGSVSVLSFNGWGLGLGEGAVYLGCYWGQLPILISDCPMRPFDEYFSISSQLDVKHQQTKSWKVEGCLVALKSYGLLLVNVDKKGKVLCRCGCCYTAGAVKGRLQNPSMLTTIRRRLPPFLKQGSEIRRTSPSSVPTMKFLNQDIFS